MIGLSGARVVLVDDVADEALPIFKALSAKGIPVIYFDGKLKSLPKRNEQQSGIRLAILDMDLGWGGTTEENMASTLVRYLEGVLRPDNGPYGIIAWTNHPNLINIFERYLFTSEKVPNPIFSLPLTKAECKNSKGEIKLNLLKNKLEKKLDSVSPLMFLQAWEGKSFSAATDVTNSLSVLADEEAENLDEWISKWKEQLLNILNAMAKAEVEKHLDNETCLSGLYSSLNPLHADRMEKYSSDLKGTFKQNTEEILNQSGECNIRSKAKINSMLHLSMEKSDKLALGNIYIYAINKKPIWVPTISSLLDDMMNPAGDRTKEIRKDLNRKSKIAIIEVSAACDHAQKNIRIPRFLAGLIVPNSLKSRIKRKAGFIWEFGPFQLKEPIIKKGHYYLFLSSRHLIALTDYNSLKMQSNLQLRIQALNDLQNWFANHTSRPGIMKLT